MAEQADDAELLRRAVAGDENALETLLLARFDRLVSAIALRIPGDVRSAISAEDVVQDALIVVFQRIADFEPRSEGAFFAWLVQIAENRLLDAVTALRADKRGGGRARVGDVPGESGDLVPLIELLATHSRSPSRAAAAVEAATALHRALESLEPDHREVLRLRYIEARPVDECARQIGRSAGAVHMLLGRALAALRARMGDSGRYLTRKP